MGQNALAVVYGIPLNAALYDSLRSDPSDEYSEIDELCNDFEMGAEGDCLGISVGTRIYAKDGERELEGAIPVAELPAFLGDQIMAAELRWRKLATAILKKKNIVLPTPELMLVTVERA